ncbi:MAG: BBP7 family outer membrane beta-barrel protein [Pirellulales bacterium]|nr:BBP7 family outer membrane beta-barrel protein [Pirellulales bacterium]
MERHDRRTRCWRLSGVAAAICCSLVVAGDRCARAECAEEFGCGACVSSPGSRFWLRADYLAWQLSGTDLPALVTSSPGGTPNATAGVLGQSTTAVLVGNEQVGDRYRSGFMVSGGYWLDECGCTAIVADYFDAGRDGYSAVYGPSTSVIYARPFYNAEEDQPDAQLVNVPDDVSGTVSVRNYSDFRGAGAALQSCLWSCGDCCRTTEIAFLGGYRYYRHDSELAINENLTALANTTTPYIPGTNIAVMDRFAARNEFHGGEIGLQGRMQRAEFWIDGAAMLAVGGHRRRVVVDGSTDVTVPNVGSSSSSGGILTSTETNIGAYSDSQAAVIPRFRLGAGCQLTERLSVRAGYSVIIWDDVVQGANALPPGLRTDPRNWPPVTAGGGPDPAFPGIVGDTFVAHGADVGLQFDY